MEVSSFGSGKAVVSLEMAEVGLLMSSMTEAMEALDAWELPIRMGVERRDIEELFSQFAAVWRGIQEADRKAAADSLDE